MKGKIYFTLREAHDEQRHIATIGVETFTSKAVAKKAFNEKIKEALSEHFDTSCKLRNELNPADYVFADPHIETFSLTNDGDDTPHNEEFEIEQTWMY